MSEAIFKPINPKNNYKEGSLLANDSNPQQIQQSLMGKKFLGKAAKKNPLKTQRGSSYLQNTQIISNRSYQITHGVLARKDSIEKQALRKDGLKKAQQTQLITGKQVLSVALAKKDSVVANKSAGNLFLSSQQALLSGAVRQTGYRELSSKKYSLQFNSTNLIHNKNEQTIVSRYKGQAKISSRNASQYSAGKNLADEPAKTKPIAACASQNYLQMQEKKESKHFQEKNFNLVEIEQQVQFQIQQNTQNYQNSSIANPINSMVIAQNPPIQLSLHQKKTYIDDAIKTVSINVINNGKLVKSTANPQGPSSSLSGQQITSKSCLTSRSPNKDKDTPSCELRMASLSPEHLKYPLSEQDAKKRFRHVLNDFEMQEISQFNNKIYYLGQNCDSKLKGHSMKMVPQQSLGSRRQSFVNKQSQPLVQALIPSDRQTERLRQMNIFNYGYDDDQGDYKTVMRDHLGYRYEVLEFLGSGSFGQALKCLDHKTGEKVAVKVIRNKKKFQYQAGMELQILKYLNNHDPHDQNNVIRVYDYQLFREHLIISFELLSINLYEFIRNNNFAGVSQNLIRRFAIQILQALKYHQDHGLVHCDLKPENILLKQQNKSGIKVIDYGSSCFIGQRIYTYIQSRFYRAPEIILGIPYTTAIDMWSFGAIVAELYTGFPLFPGESEVEQLAYIMELGGVPKNDVLELAQRRHLFFDKNNQPIQCPNSRGKVRQPGAKKLEDILKCTDAVFIDFLNKCFEWHPVNRMTPLEALQHPWILDGLPEKVLKHHNKMFGHQDNKKILREMTYSEIQGFPKDKKNLSIHDIVREIQIEDEKKQTDDLKEVEPVSKQEPVPVQISNKLKCSTQNQGQIVQQKSHTVQAKQSKTQNLQKKVVVHKNPSPNKARKTRKQRKLTSQMKHNLTAEFNKIQLINNSESQSKQNMMIRQNDSIINEAEEIAIDYLQKQNQYASTSIINKNQQCNKLI